MDRLYSVPFSAQSVTTAGGDRDLWYIAPADDKHVVIVGWEFSQYSDVGEAQEEILSLALIKGHSTVGSGGTAVTAADPYRSGANWSATVRHNDTTIASAGTAVTIMALAANVRQAPNPYFLPERLWVPITQADNSVVLRLLAGPADDLTANGTLWFLERG